MKKKTRKLIISLMIIGALGFNYYQKQFDVKNSSKPVVESLNNILEYNGTSYSIINDNQPQFNESDFTLNAFEKYSELDNLGRAGVAVANISQELMPTKERESIGQIKPSGWHTIKYDIVDGKYLYNRCHLIGYQLTGENANKLNLITCTRTTNTVGMLQFENQVAEYIKKTNNHVLYRVTPIYENDNLVASGIQMEAFSVEDKGVGIKFNVYVYNVEPGIKINYQTGESELE